jgi:hypothetical protein
MYVEPTYRIIRVGNAEPTVAEGNSRLKELSEEFMKQNWMGSHFGRGQVLAYYENNPAHIQSNKSFFQTFSQAYNNHLDVILSPDDVWTIISLQFSKCVNDHAEEMRSMFVSHDGSKFLNVVTWKDLGEVQWGEFFDLILNEIQTNTKEGIVDLLACIFSTTQFVEKMISTAILMDSLKSFFAYGRVIPLCGIRNVLFMGDLEDWNKLLEKLQALKPFAAWTQYVENLIPIIEQFIESYKGNVDYNFWDRIMNEKHGSLGSGSTTYISLVGFYPSIWRLWVGHRSTLQIFAIILFRYQFFSTTKELV